MLYSIQNKLLLNHDLMAKLLNSAALFVAEYILSMPQISESKFRFGIQENLKLFYSELDSEFGNNPIIIAGAGERSIGYMKLLSGKPLILVDIDPFLMKVLFAMKRRLDLDVVLITSDCAVVDLPNDFASLLISELFVHQLDEDKIAPVVEHLSMKLRTGGMVFMVEPESGCCELDSPEKIGIITKTLESLFSNVSIYSETIGCPPDSSVQYTFFATTKK